MTISPESEPIRIAFVCVQNAGRSQMAYAFAREEVRDRALEDRIQLITGGTKPADHVHEGVIEAMAGVGIDISDRVPREVTFEEIQRSDYVITMGCSADDVCPAGWGGETRDWDFPDPEGRSGPEVSRIRDEIQTRVSAFFAEIQAR